MMYLGTMYYLALCLHSYGNKQMQTARLNYGIFHQVWYNKDWMLCIFEPVHKILILVAYGQMPLINAHTDSSSKTRGLMFGLQWPFTSLLSVKVPKSHVLVHILRDQTV